MKYRITVEVEGNTYSDSNFEVEVNGITVGIITEDNDLKKLYVEKVVNEDADLPTIEKGSGVVKHVFNFNRPKEADELVEKLHYFESIGSFWWHIKSLNIENAEETWVPESEAERNKVSLISFNLKREYRSEPLPIRDHQVKDLLELEDYEKEMTIPMSFYRESVINFEKHKYINAYQNSFLFLEGLFGNGKSGFIQICSAFSSSEELKNAVQAMIDKVRSNKNHENFRILQEDLEAMNLEFNVHGIIRWLVKTRGQVNHFSVKSSVKQGHPLLHNDYRLHAYFAQSVCLLVYTNFHTRVLKDRGYS